MKKRQLFDTNELTPKNRKERPFFVLSKPINEIGDKLNISLFKLMHSNKTKLTKKQEQRYMILSQQHKMITEKNRDFFEQDFLDVVDLLNKLVKYFYNNILPSYLQLLKENNISEEEIDKHKKLLHIGVSISTLRKINRIEQFDFNEITIQENKGIDLQSSLNEIILNGNNILPKQVFLELCNYLSMDFNKEDIMYILGLKRGDESIILQNKFGLDGKYKYDKNIFLFVYMINTMLEYFIGQINETLHFIIKNIKPNFSNEEINIISYNSVKEFLNFIVYKNE